MHAAADTGPRSECLATAVYFEAKGEPLRGQLAVAQVILNRTRSGRFPASVCGVVSSAANSPSSTAAILPAVAARLARPGTRRSPIARIARMDGAGERRRRERALLPRPPRRRRLAR